MKRVKNYNIISITRGVDADIIIIDNEEDEYLSDPL